MFYQLKWLACSNAAQTGGGEGGGDAIICLRIITVVHDDFNVNYYESMTMKTVLQDITNYNSNNDVVRDNIDNDDNKKECSSLCY